MTEPVVVAPAPDTALQRRKSLQEPLPANVAMDTRRAMHILGFPLNKSLEDTDMAGNFN